MKLEEKMEVDFSTDLIKALATNLYISVEAFQRMYSENKKFFELPNSKTVLGHLRTYAIQRQIYLGAFRPDALYTAQFRQTNTFKYKALFLETENFVLNVGRTEKRGQLLSLADYKKELARSNAEEDLQIQLEFFDTDTSRLKGEKNYAILAYGYNEKVGITHFDVLVPSSDYTGIILPIKSLHIPKLEIAHNFDQINEPDITSLKEDLKKKLG